jgi:Mg2+ and Co2+ transporter CorA
MTGYGCKAESPWAFLLFLLFLAGIVVVQMLWFKRKKWF